jgi:hypothetical protein
MPQEKKQFQGILNLQDSEDIIQSGHHIDAMNITFRNGIAENILGNRELGSLSLLLPSTGTNVCICAYNDELRGKLIIFNANSLGFDGIYKMSTLDSAAATRIYQAGTASYPNILNFNTASKIHSVNILYGETEADDILLFVDSLGRPTKMKMSRFIANEYSASEINRTYIDVHVNPPLSPIKCTYEHDNAVTANNVRDSLFQFRYRFVYDDNERSTWSQASITPLPFDYLKQQGTKNNSRIALFMSTGGSNVKKIEIAAKETKGEVTSDYFLVDSIDKAILSLSDNSVYKYNFYNNGVYEFLDQREIDLIFDKVPDEANTQELLNGNVIIYGGIKEGYDNPTVTGSLSSELNNYLTQPNGLLFVASSRGEDSSNTAGSIVLTIAGTGTLDVNNNTSILDSVNATGHTYIINMVDSLGAAVNITYDATSQTVDTILAGIGTIATGLGFTVSSISNHSITISKSGVKLLNSSFRANNQNIVADSFNVYSELAKNSFYSFGLVYFDVKGKTNGVVYPIQAFDKSTSEYASFPPLLYDYIVNYVKLSITSRPPSWAVKYSVVRSDNKTIDKQITWVTNDVATGSSDSAISADALVTYVGIQNMGVYNEILNSESGINYDFVEGDRVKFVSRYQTGTFNDLKAAYASGTYDYEIIGTEINPKIGGKARDGKYLKLRYSDISSDISAQFKVDGSMFFGNYLIVIYRQKKRSSSDKTFFYEFGPSLGIGDAGLATRYHIGNGQASDDNNGNQSTNLTYPALVRFHTGDCYTKYRNNIPIVLGKYDGSLTSYSHSVSAGNIYSTMKMSMPSQDNSAFRVSSQTEQLSNGYALGDYPLYANDAGFFFFNKSTTEELKIRIRGTFRAYGTKTSYMKLVLKKVPSLAPLTVTTTDLTDVVDISNAPVASGSPGAPVEVQFDKVISVRQTDKISLMAEGTTFAQSVVLFSEFNIEVYRNVEKIHVTEELVSDSSRLYFSGNGRPFLFDRAAKRGYYGNLVRYGQNYLAGSSVNDTNRFYDSNQDEYDLQHGDIERFKSRDKSLRVFQQRNTGTVPIFQSLIQDTSGSSLIAQSDRILNKIQYYSGNYGIGNQPCSLASSSFVDYFVDTVNGAIVRVSLDGITALSKTYKLDDWAVSKLSKYYKFGYKDVIFGAYDKLNNNYVLHLQSVANIEPDLAITDTYTLAFNEQTNSFVSFYSYYPEAMVFSNGGFYSMKSGKAYLHDVVTAGSRARFYGVSGACYIQCVFNSSRDAKKRFNALTYLGDGVWEVVSNTSIGQDSNLIEADFSNVEDKKHATMLRDSNSPGGLINGDVLKGDWIKVKLSAKSPQNKVNLHLVEVNLLIQNR